MYLIETSPLKKIKGFKKLSYFSTEEFKRGDIVKAPFRNKEIYVLVHNSKKLKEVKADVKSKDFMPKKIRAQKAINFLPDFFVKSVFDLADEFLLEPGSVLDKMLGANLSKNLEKVQDKITVYSSNKEENKKEEKDDEIINFALSAPKKERIDTYKSIVREKLAQKESVLIVAPNMDSAKELYEELSVGISKMVYLYDNQKSAKKLLEDYAFFSTLQEPFCLIGTSGALAVFNENITYYILEKEAWFGYKSLSYPKLHTKDILTTVAKNKGAVYLLADTFLSLDTYKKLKEDTLQHLGSLSSKIRTRKKIKEVRIKEELKAAKEKKQDYPFVSTEILKEIINTVKNGENFFIFTPKRGLASQIICKDCLNTIKCPTCFANLKLHKDKKTYLLCHRCGYSTDANITCPFCGSWRLLELGVASIAVAEYIERKTGIKVAVINSDTAKSEKEIKELLKKEKVIVGTYKALPFLRSEQFTKVAAISLDSLLSLPDFNIEEKIFYILNLLLESAKEELFVQVKDENILAISAFSKRRLKEFVDKELSLRQKFLWPPYAKIIKISVEGSKKQIIEKMQSLVNELYKYKIRVFRDFDKIDKNTYRLSALIKIENDKWAQSKELKEFLELLPSDFQIEINPESIF